MAKIIPISLGYGVANCSQDEQIAMQILRMGKNLTANISFAIEIRKNTS